MSTVIYRIKPIVIPKNKIFKSQSIHQQIYRQLLLTQIIKLQTNQIIFQLGCSLQLQWQQMRADKISIEQAKQIMVKYFTTSYNIEEIFTLFKNKRSQNQIIESLKQSIKDMLIQIEGELFAAKQIQSLKIYDHINTTNIMEHIINLQDILTPQAAVDYLTYYRYKSQFFIISRFQILQVPVDPVTSKKKLAIYECFVDYFQTHGLFDTVTQQVVQPQQEGENNQVGDFELNNFAQLYSQQEIEYIFKLYDQTSGQLGLIIQKLQKKGFVRQKCSKSNVKLLLINYLTVGIARIYKLSNNLDKFSGCSWQKFQQVHKRLMKNFTFEEKKLVLRMGVFNNLEDQDIMVICIKIGIRYRPIGYPKWTKDIGGCKLYRKEKMSIMEQIRNQMKNIVVEEIIKQQKPVKYQ